MEGGDNVLRDRTLVAKVDRDSDELEALLAPGATAQQLLERLITEGAQITKFELVEPSLNDIFIEKVRGAA